MNDAFIYGYAVEGDNFTDRENETKRLKANFEHGINTLLISNRRIGKTSLVRHVLYTAERVLKAEVKHVALHCRHIPQGKSLRHA